MNAIGFLERWEAALAGYKKARYSVFVDARSRTSNTKVSKEQLRQRFQQA